MDILNELVSARWYWACPSSNTSFVTTASWHLTYHFPCLLVLSPWAGNTFEFLLLKMVVFLRHSHPSAFAAHPFVLAGDLKSAGDTSHAPQLLSSASPNPIHTYNTVTPLAKDRRSLRFSTQNQQCSQGCHPVCLNGMLLTHF